MRAARFRLPAIQRNVVVVLAAGCTVLAAGCASGARTLGTGDPRVVAAVSTTNVWGSIVAQLGGTHVRATSIISNPNTDPHDYEPTPADARGIATAQLFVENGVGYDTWAARTVAAERDRRRVVLDVGELVGADPGDNPHRWYFPGDVEKVADAVTAALRRIDPKDAAYFTAQRKRFETVGLGDYHRLIADIRQHYAGVKVGASESVIAPMAATLGLDLVTPTSFLTAISEGGEPSAADKATIDAQIRDQLIAAYVVNSQNSTPDVTAQVESAHRRGIPVTAVTETLTPARATFQQWQVAQLEALRTALRQGTGR